jgi:hypothetical protein
MKRSEVISLIVDVFEMQGTGVLMREKDAMSILDALENINMLPPLTRLGYHEWEEE